MSFPRGHHIIAIRGRIVVFESSLHRRCPPLWQKDVVIRHCVLVANATVAASVAVAVAAVAAAAAVAACLYVVHYIVVRLFSKM